MSALGRAARAFGETINIGVNSATGGLFNRGIGYLMGATPQQVEQMNQGFRRDTGTGGNLAAGVGQIYGAGKVFGAGKAALGAVRAAPTAVALVPTAGIGTAARFLAGRAGPGLVPVAARALPKASTVAKAAAGLGVLGLNMTDGLDSTTPAPAAAAPEKPVEAALAAGRVAEPAVTPYDRQLAALNAILQSPNMTLSDLQSATNMLPKQPKPPTAKETIMGETAKRFDALFKRDMAAAGDDPVLGAKAMEADANRWAALAGTNPLTMQQAMMFAQGDPEE